MRARQLLRSSLVISSVPQVFVFTPAGTRARHVELQSPYELRRLFSAQSTVLALNSHPPKDRYKSGVSKSLRTLSQAAIVHAPGNQNLSKLFCATLCITIQPQPTAAVYHFENMCFIQLKQPFNNPPDSLVSSHDKH